MLALHLFHYSDPLAHISTIWTDESSFLKYSSFYKSVNHSIYGLFSVRILGIITS